MPFPKIISDNEVRLLLTEINSLNLLFRKLFFNLNIIASVRDSLITINKKNKNIIK